MRIDSEGGEEEGGEEGRGRREEGGDERCEVLVELIGFSLGMLGELLF